jgi:hypothetical protein
MRQCPDRCVLSICMFDEMVLWRGLTIVVQPRLVHQGMKAAGGGTMYATIALKQVGLWSKTSLLHRGQS